MGAATFRKQKVSRLVRAGAQPLPTDEPATELRIFRAGVNTFAGIPDSTFTERSAELILADYEKHGIPLQIDLEHLSLDDQAANFNPDSMGCGDLEIRRDEDGGAELWLTNIKWAPEGQRRLKAKSQRYWSPVFRRDTDTGEITALFNLGLVASPATDGLRPLIAASSRKSSTTREAAAMDPESMDVQKIAEGMGLDLPGLAKALGIDPGASLEDTAAALAVVSDKLTKIAGLSPAPAPEDAPAEEPVDASDAPAEEEPAANADAPAEEDDAELKAARMVLLRDTNTKTTSEALSMVATYKAAYLAQEEAKAKLAKDRQALEAAERRSIGAALVKAGLAPAMVWADTTAKVLTLAPVLQGQSIEQLRAYAARANAQPSAFGGPKPPADNTHGLSERELQKCRARNIDPAKYAATKAATVRS